MDLAVCEEKGRVSPAEKVNGKGLHAASRQAKRTKGRALCLSSQPPESMGRRPSSWRAWVDLSQVSYLNSQLL